MSTPDRYPIFPLGTVLFPGGPLALRIFEPRYLDMVAERMRRGEPFGVCLIREGREAGAPAIPHEIGTFARIRDWDPLPDGLLGITAVGEGRFRLVECRAEPDGLVTAQVQVMPDPPPTPVPDAHRAMAEQLETALSRAGELYEGIETRFDDAGWVGHRICELLPIPMAHKQHLLEIEDPLVTLERAAEILALLSSQDGGADA